jgi:hypothetical protein
MQRLDREIAQGETAQTNDDPGAGSLEQAQSDTPGQPDSGEQGDSGEQAAARESMENTEQTTRDEQQQTSQQTGNAEEPQSGQSGTGSSQTASADQPNESGAQPGGDRGGDQGGTQQTRDPSGQNAQDGGQLALNVDQLLGGPEGRGGGGGPITGTDFAPWSDQLREVEQLVELPELRNSLAQSRERARQFRQDYRRAQERPDWAEVRLEVYGPLVEVSRAITEELARRNPDDSLVPIDRDPVPTRYSELVRRYYEALGKDQ